MQDGTECTYHARTIRASALKGALVGLACLGTASCGWDGDTSAPSLIGYWDPVEINGEPTSGSNIELHLDGVTPDTLKVTGYRLYIGCRDSGRWDQKRGVFISDERMTDQATQGQCDVHDPKRLDALRRMTHEGASVRLDRKSLSATLSTQSGQTARFDFMDMTPVD